MTHSEETRVSAPSGSLRELAGTLHWKPLFLFSLLLVACVLPLKLSGFVHELGHVMEIKASGGQVYGVDFPCLVYSVEFYPVYQMETLPVWRFIFSGVLLCALVGLLICGLTSLARPASTWRPVGTVIGGLSLIISSWYPVYGYYGNVGDFSGMREAWKPWGDYVWLVFPAGCFVIGYFVGKFYVPLQEAWLPSASRMERTVKALLVVGIPYALGAIVLAFGKRPLPALAAALLTGLGGLVAIWKANPAPATASRFKLRLYLIPLVIAVAFESYLCANDWVIRFEKRKYDAQAPFQFEDERLARMPELKGRISFDLGPDGKLYLAREMENVLCTFDVRTGASETLLSGLAHPFRVRCRDGGVYVAEQGIYRSDDDTLLLTPETGRRLGRIIFYDPNTRTTRVICDNLICPCGLDIDSNGDVYFTEEGKTLCVVRNGQTEKTVLRDGLDDAVSLALSPGGDLYIGSFPHWRYAEDGALCRFSKDGKSSETVAVGTSTPFDLRCDSEGNLYIGGGGYSSITMLPAGSRQQLVTLRGSYFVVCLAVSAVGDIYYATYEGVHPRMRVLRRLREAAAR